MQKRRSKKISFLIVPEDDAEPYSFRIRTNVVKGLYVLGAILTVHIILGAIFYWKYANLLSINHAITKYNTQLQEDNKRVIGLANQLNDLQLNYKKITSLLGVENVVQGASNGTLENRDSNEFFGRILPTVSSESRQEVNLQEARNRLIVSPKKSKIHKYAENIPSMLPVKGFLTLDYKKNGWFMPKTHAGIDIVAKKGTVIRAAGAGVIIFSNWTFDLGNLIIIDHGGGILSYYGHNQRLLKSEKSYVKKGEPIALLGSSGNSSGPHLHFEIWKDGTPVDPKEYLLALNTSISTN